MSFRSTIAAVLLLALIPGSLQAKPNASDWGNVRRLDIGSTIVVATKNGERYKGDLKHVDDNSMTLLVRYSDTARQAVEIQRDDVREVRKSKSRLLSAIVGAGIGLGVGIAIGAAYDGRHPYSDDPGLGKVIYGSTGMLIGTAAGGALPFKGKKIYVAP